MMSFEEGQEEQIVRIDTSDTHYINREFQTQAKSSNLMKALNQIEFFFNKFSEPEKHVPPNKSGKV